MTKTKITPLYERLSRDDELTCSGRLRSIPEMTGQSLSKRFRKPRPNSRPATLPERGNG